jgi:DNA-binding transcriptional LysR family regulator
MEYKKIWYFLQVAKRMNIKRAATEMYISPQALSKHIISLEEEIGTQLFYRTGSGISLTETGAQLKRSFEGLYQSLDDAWDAFLMAIQEQENVVHIAFYRSLPQIAVVSFVTEFLIEHNPELKLELTGCDLANALEMLKEGKCDIAITNIHEGSERDDLSFIRLARLPAQIIVSKNHPWCKKAGGVTEEDLANEPIVTYKSSNISMENFHRIIQDKKGGQVRTIRAGDEDAIMQQVVLGNGYVVRPVYTVKNYIDKLAVLELPQELKFNINVVIGYRKNHPLAKEFEKMRNIRVIL